MYFIKGKNKLKAIVKQKSQKDASPWDVVMISFKVFRQNLLFWIKTNLYTVIYSLGLITIPAAEAAMYYTVEAGLHDPGESKINVSATMKTGFKQYFWRAILISFIKWSVYFVIIFSIYFWITQKSLFLRFISIISLYALVIWWISSGYFIPILIDNPQQKAINIIKRAIKIGFMRPFQSLLFTFISTLLFIMGFVLLGPILLIIPVLRSILMTHGYWYLLGNEIPGFMEIFEYVNKNENLIN